LTQVPSTRFVRSCDAKRRRRGLATLFVAVLLMVALVGGCGASSPKPDLAAQDRLVQLSNRLAAVRAQYVAAQRRLAQARRAVARVRSGAAPSKPAAPRGIVTARDRVLPSLDFSRGTFCAPLGSRAKGAQGRALRALALRRRQALYYLNLSCRAA
jgi:hypothetical protein